MRQRGEGSLFRIGECKTWYVKVKGKRFATGTRIKAIALAKLQEKIGEANAGTLTDTTKLRYEQIKESMLLEYKHRGANLYKRMASLKHLDFFEGRIVSQIGTDLLREFVALRKRGGASAGTINRSLAMLRAMIHLAQKEGKLRTAIPYFPMLKEAAPRVGFVEHEQFVRLLEALPLKLRAFALLLYTTGVRTGEAKKIEWRQVFLDEHVIRLERGQTKNKALRALPLVEVLVEMLRQEPEKKGLLFKFGDFRKAWKRACDSAGLTIIPHDLRRSAVRNMIRAGVSQSVAMSISGHKTISVFLRYDVTDETDKHAAMNRIGANLGQMLLTSKSTAGVTVVDS